MSYCVHVDWSSKAKEKKKGMKKALGTMLLIFMFVNQFLCIEAKGDSQKDPFLVR